MATSVALLGWDEDPIRVVQDVDWALEDREDSTNRLRVTTSLAEADGVAAEQELIFKGRRFTVVDVERDRAQDRAVLVADEAQAALADVVVMDFRPDGWTLERAMGAVLAGTRWTLGEVTGIRNGRADFDEITALDALHFLARHQDAELSFDSLRRRVNITGATGRTFEYVFTYGRQLANIEKSVRAPVTTVIYPTMAEDVKLDPVENYGYYYSQGLSRAEAVARFRKEDYWEDSRYEIAENMTRDAQKRLEEEAWPRVTYTLTAQATLDVDGVDDFDLAELRLGDTVYVWDQEIDAKLSAEVTAVTTSSDQSQNELTLSTLPASLGDSVEGRYFGDSGRPGSGIARRSGPQPRPSMPIFESITDYGVGEFRWNGQDHEGNYTTIPQRFGTLETIVAPLETGVVPSPTGPTVFRGSDIKTRGGGISIVGFNGYGEYALWFQMIGWDGRTRSELSEPLVFDVPPAWDPGPTQDRLEELNTRVGPALEKSISEAVTQAQNSLAGFQLEWDENWEPGGFDELRARASTIEQDLENGFLDVYDDAQAEYARLQAIANRALRRAGENTVHDGGFETEYWDNPSDPSAHVSAGSRSRMTLTSDAYQGARALRYGSGAAVWVEVARFPVEPGQMWRFAHAFARSTGAPVGSANGLRVFDQDGQLVYNPEGAGVSTTGTPSDGTWTYLSGYAEVPSGVSEFQLRLHSNASEGWSAYDAVTAQDVTQVYPALEAAKDARKLAGELAGDAREEAIAQAAANAQVEYDRLQELAERALSRAGDNLIEDPGFETEHWPNEWHGLDGRVVRTTSTRRTGDQALLIEHSSDVTEFSFPDVDVELGQSYRLSVWYRTWTNSSVDLSDEGSALVFYDSDTGAELAASEPFTVGSTWRRVDVIYTVNSSVESIRPAIRASWDDHFVIFDDASLREVGAAAEALRQAELARQAAEAAHLAAGEAEDAASQAQTTANAKSTSFFELGEPSGTANTGDVWWQYEVINNRRVVIGEWHWGDGVWESAEIAESRVPLIDIGTGTYNELDGNRLSAETVDADRAIIRESLKARSVDMVDFTASRGFLDNAMVNLIQGRMANFDQGLIGSVLLKDRAVSAQHMNVGLGADMIPDAKFDTSWWDSAVPLSDIKQSSAAKGNDTLNITQNRIDAAGGLIYIRTQRFEAIPEAQYTAVFDSNRLNPSAGGSNDVYQVSAQGFTKGGEWVQEIDLSANYSSGSGWRSESFTFTVPDDPGVEVWEIEWRFETLDGGSLWVGNPSLRRIAEGRLTIDGLLRATEGELQRLFFNEAVGHTIAAGSGEFLELNADQIRSNSWTGITATGATFQTHADPDRGVKLLPAGLRAWDTAGNIKFDLSSTTGDMLATGTWQTATSGNRIQIRDTSDGGVFEVFTGNDSSRGHIRARGGTLGSRMALTYGDFGTGRDDVPFLAVGTNWAWMQYRSARIRVGDYAGSQRAEIDGGPNAVIVRNDLDLYGGRIRVRYGDFNHLGWIGQRPESGGAAQMEIRPTVGSLRVAASINIPTAYNTTTTLDANVQIDSSGRLRRSTSASKYKVDARDLTVSDAILDVPLVEWMDKAELEEMADFEQMQRPLAEAHQEAYDAISLRRVPGVIAEAVEAHGGKQFVNYGPDGDIEEVKYDRLSLAQIQVLKRRNEALEARVAALEGAA